MGTSGPVIGPSVGFVKSRVLRVSPGPLQVLKSFPSISVASRKNEAEGQRGRGGEGGGSGRVGDLELR